MKKWQQQSSKTDGDDNDEITLRDPMKEAGKDLGSLFKKFLKKK